MTVTYEEMRREAYRLLGDAADWLRSDWSEGHGPTAEQNRARLEAFEHIECAKAALNRGLGPR